MSSWPSRRTTLAIAVLMDIRREELRHAGSSCDSSYELAPGEQKLYELGEGSRTAIEKLK